MSDLTFHDLRRANVERCGAAFPSCNDWSPTDWATAVAGEVGEACNLIKKMRRGETIPIRELAHELADAVIYLDLLAARLEIDLAAAVRAKFNIVSVRVGSDLYLPEPGGRTE